MSEKRANQSEGYWQFDLRSLLIFMAMWAMFLSLVFSRKNPWPISVMSAVYLLLIGRSFLDCIRSRFWQGLVICMASLLFVVSLFLPAIGLRDATQPAYGWTAAWVVASPSILRAPLAIVYCAMMLGNLLAVMSPWFVRRMLRGRDRWYPWMMAPCAVIAWCVPLLEHLTLHMGFYCWSLSFTLIAMSAATPLIGYWRGRRSQTREPVPTEASIRVPPEQE